MARIIDCIIKLQDQFSEPLKMAERNAGVFDKKLNNLSKNAKKYQDGFKGASNLFGGISDKLEKAAVPIGGFMTYAGKKGMDFEKGMAGINTLLDDSSHLNFYENAVKDTVRNYGMSIDDAQDMTYNFISAVGDKGKAGKDMINELNKLIVGGGADAKSSVLMVTGAMKGYNDVSLETQKKVQDLSFMTAKLGTTDIPSLATAMPPLFGLAHSLNFEMSDLFSVFAAGTGVTGDTAQVATQFKGVMVGLTKPTKEMSALMKKYGFNNAQAMIKSKGLTGVMDILKKETNGNSDALAKLFGSSEAIVLMSALLNGSYGDLIEKNKKLKNSTGATDKAFGKIANTTKFKFVKALQGLKMTAVEVGQILLPTFRKVLDTITRLTTKFNGMSKEQKKFIVDIGLFIVKSFLFTKALSKITGGLSKNVKTFRKWARVIKRSGGILKFLASPMAKIIIIATLLGLAAVFIAKHWKQISNVFKKVGSSLSKFTGIGKKELKKLQDTFKRFGKNTGKHFSKAFKDMKKIVLKIKSLFKSIGKALMLIRKPLMLVAKFIAVVFVAKIMFAFNMVAQVISIAISVISGVIGGLIDIFQGVIDFVVGVFTGDWDKAWNGVKQIFSGVVDILKTLWDGVIDLLTAPVQAVVDILDGVFKDKVAGIKNLWNELKEWLKHPISGTVNLIKTGSVSGKKDGSHATGISYIPFNGYMAELHEGERVLTKQENKQYENKNGKANGINIHIQHMECRNENDIKAVATEIVNQIKLNKNNIEFSY